jgi:peptide/nickel transport system substrate-binding protein
MRTNRYGRGIGAVIGRRGRRPVAVLLALGLAVSSCGDDRTTAPRGPARPRPPRPRRRPRLLTFGEFSEPVGLDPIVSTGHGSTGAIETAAIYDTIVRYNPKTKKYENRTAESLTPNADLTQWVVKLRSGITFTDGTT